jgi:hypothetical protein
MRKILAVLVVLACSVPLWAEADKDLPGWALGAYMLGGYDARSFTYVSPASTASTLDASGWNVELGATVRWTPISLLSLELTGGMEWYLGASQAFAAMGTAGYSSSSFYLSTYENGADNLAALLALDLFLNVPFLPVNIFVGYKIGFFPDSESGAAAARIEGMNHLRFGAELLVTRWIGLKVIGELPLDPWFGMAPARFSDGASVRVGSGFDVQAAVVFAF